MIIYSGSKAEFMAEVLDDTIAYTIRDSIFEETHRKTPDAEFHSWVNSLEYMYKVLNDGGGAAELGRRHRVQPPPIRRNASTSLFRVTMPAIPQTWS